MTISGIKASVQSCVQSTVNQAKSCANAVKNNPTAVKTALVVGSVIAINVAAVVVHNHYNVHNHYKTTAPLFGPETLKAPNFDQCGLLGTKFMSVLSEGFSPNEDVGTWMDNEISESPSWTYSGAASKTFQAWLACGLARASKELGAFEKPFKMDPNSDNMGSLLQGGIAALGTYLFV